MFYTQQIILIRHVDSTIYTLPDQILRVVLLVSLKRAYNDLCGGYYQAMKLMEDC
jgi:hypothetical protein